jgi:SAM-dependent methyltransferase
VTSAFSSVAACWVCDGRTLVSVHHARLDLHEYARQDPELAALSGNEIDIVRCRRCGFAQPAALPSLPRYFDRLYDQRWSDDWIAREHDAACKDRIFERILSGLERRLAPERRRLLDVGAHAGRFIRLARARGWQADGLELNPKTAAYAASASGGTVHRANLFTFDAPEAAYDAVTMTDVLEHIPDPRAALRRVHQILAPAGWIAVKVPNGPAQRLKERVRALLRSGYRPTIADNLVHVNHFGARALTLALTRESFDRVSVGIGAPELSQAEGTRLDRLVRLSIFELASRLPGGVHTPLALNLQAYGRRV